MGCNPSPAERILNLPIHSGSPEGHGGTFPMDLNRSACCLRNVWQDEYNIKCLIRLVQISWGIIFEDWKEKVFISQAYPDIPPVDFYSCVSHGGEIDPSSDQTKRCGFLRLTGTSH